MTKQRMNKVEFLELAQKELGRNTASRSELKTVCDKHNLQSPRWLFNDANRRVGHGIYSIDHADFSEKTTRNNPVAKTTELNEVLIPEKNPLYIKFGHHKKVTTLINSGAFFPAYITGLSGNGKTFMVEQICAQLKREMVRVNITAETDEDDLLGGFRLVDGETRWFDGPVIRAMKRGAILLLDEVDLNSIKIMCLQPVMEGKGVLLKKINKFVQPAPGFNIIATANTKGKGSEHGQFVGTEIMNEAFLERFPITFEQSYPTVTSETKILKKIFSDAGVTDTEIVEEWVDHLVQWANQTRKTFDDDGVAEIISTRRLVHIANSFLIYGDKKDAVNMCISRFDEEVRGVFIRGYNALDPEEIRKAEEAKKKEEEELQKQLEEKDLNVSSILATNI